MNKRLLMIMAILLMMTGTGFSNDKDTHSNETLSLAVTPAERLSKKWWAARHQANLALAQQGGWELVFIGDSITQGWEGSGRTTWEALYQSRKALNLGYGGDATEHVLWRIDNGELDGLQPKAVVIMIGTNNTGHRKEETPESIAAGVEAIIGRVRAKCPDAKLLLLGIFPRGATASDPMRVKNDSANVLISNFADGDRIVYLDLGAKFLNEAGELSREIMPDLLHPKEKGYAIWAEAMEPALRRLLGEQTP